MHQNLMYNIITKGEEKTLGTDREKEGKKMMIKDIESIKNEAIENELGEFVAKETRRLHEEGSFKRTLEIAQETRTQQTSSKEGVNQA